mgnify:CR=1 FL=1
MAARSGPRLEFGLVISTRHAVMASAARTARGSSRGSRSRAQSALRFARPFRPGQPCPHAPTMDGSQGRTEWRGGSSVPSRRMVGWVDERGVGARRSVRAPPQATKARRPSPPRGAPGSHAPATRDRSGLPGGFRSASRDQAAINPDLLVTTVEAPTRRCPDARSSSGAHAVGEAPRVRRKKCGLQHQDAPASIAAHLRVSSAADPLIRRAPPVQPLMAVDDHASRRARNHAGLPLSMAGADAPPQPPRRCAGFTAVHARRFLPSPGTLPRAKPLAGVPHASTSPWRGLVPQWASERGSRSEHRVLPAVVRRSDM